MDSEFQLCPRFEKSFAILGRKWNGLIIDVLLEGKCQRFAEIARKIPDMSDRVLVERLKELEEAELVQRHVSKTENGRQRITYELTECGRDLEPLMDAVHTWADKWICMEDKR